MNYQEFKQAAIQYQKSKSQVLAYTKKVYHDLLNFLRAKFELENVCHDGYEIIINNEEYTMYFSYNELNIEIKVTFCGERILEVIFLPLKNEISFDTYISGEKNSKQIFEILQEFKIKE